MQLKLFLIVFSVTSCLYAPAFTADYSGNGLLVVLGASKNSPQFKEFKDVWQLDKKFENSHAGIKVNISELNDRVESILIAAAGMELSGIIYTPFTAKLPFAISLDDDTAALVVKLGAGEKLIGKNTLRFYQYSVIVEATYTNLRGGRIAWLKFYKGTKPEIIPVKEPPLKRSKIEELRNSDRSEFIAYADKVAANMISGPPPSFKKAILDVFKASQESAFVSVKTEPRKDGNFWNYKYTYSTKLKIPGEKYNMLYSYPFINSQLDFVVVLKEADVYDKSFEKVYHHFEKQLMKDFSLAEGWTSACLPNTDKSKLSDLEIKNGKYGSVILDYSRNPKGRNVLFLRFLLYSN